MAAYLTIDDVNVRGKRVLVRSDLNTPLGDGRVADDFRIRASLPTIGRLRSEGAVVAVCSHLGRPQGSDPRLSLAPVARRMEQLAGFAVRHLREVAGPAAGEAIDNARPGDVFLLENTRFHPGETSNDPELSARMAGMVDLFCQDAFGSVHRAHASTEGVAKRVRSVAGPLLVSELESMGRLLADPPRPFLVIMGGAKVSDKLGALTSLAGVCDLLAIGGGMVFTALMAEGLQVGGSMVEAPMIPAMKQMLRGPNGAKLVVPEDVVVAREFRADSDHRVAGVGDIRQGELGLDIGPVSADRIAGLCQRAKSIFWNGPMGVFEWEAFRSGTERVARAVTSSEAFSVLGGGDSVAAVRLLGLEKQVSHLSTGGGAGLRLLEGKSLPGVEVLHKWVR